jgi:outer membrane biosynthesis protein TonB
VLVEEFEAEAREITANSTVAEIEGSGAAAFLVEVDVRSQSGQRDVDACIEALKRHRNGEDAGEVASPWRRVGPTQRDAAVIGIIVRSISRRAARSHPRRYPRGARRSRYY